MDRHNPWPLGLCSFHHLRPVFFLRLSSHLFPATSLKLRIATSCKCPTIGHFGSSSCGSPPFHITSTRPDPSSPLLQGRTTPSQGSFFSPARFPEDSMVASRDRQGSSERMGDESRSIGNDLDCEGAVHRGQPTTACQIHHDHFDVRIFARVRIRKRTRTT